ncbi:MAG: extracellular solute-binding protein [Oscillospiraceae bacterium]
MKKIIAIILTFAISMSFFTGCKNKDNTVIIYSSAEEFRNELILQSLKEQFPDFNIELQYYSTGTNAAKLKAEGKSTECDIVIGLETSYLNQNIDNLADVSYIDYSVYMDDCVPEIKKYVPWERGAGCIALRTDLLKEKKLPEPTCYEDLLKPEYKGLISMPNPKASGTGYAFVKSLVNAWGEKEAFDYFDKLAKNISQFTSSGSGPVNALVQGEATIGLGMTFQAVQEINNGVPLKIIFFEEGSPNTICGTAIIDGKQEKPAVKEVFEFLNSTVVYEDKKLMPEKIFKDQDITTENYPQDIKYSDMTSEDAVAEREKLLANWSY